MACVAFVRLACAALVLSLLQGLHGAAMSVNSMLTLIAASALVWYLGRKLLPVRDLLLVFGEAAAIGFMLAGVFHSWALVIGLALQASVAIALYYDYRDSPQGLIAGVFDVYLRIEAGTAFVMAIGLAIFAVFAIEQGEKNVARLAEYIAIYEPRESIEWVPRVDDSVVGQWLLSTEDPAAGVIRFYYELAAREGWAVTSHAPSSFIRMRTNGPVVSVQASESGGRQQTTALITLERP